MGFLTVFAAGTEQQPNCRGPIAQVVFKAQRILVPGRQADGSDSEYVGLWHVDGNREHVAAVVLYYYNVDEELKGGDMEFCGREPMDILGIGDCSNNFEDFGQLSLRTALREEPDRKVTNCRVPIRTLAIRIGKNSSISFARLSQFEWRS